MTATRQWLPVTLAGLVACAGDPASTDETPTTPEAGLDPAGDEDGDGYTNAEEAEANSDPFDATDRPYFGGWRKGDCRHDIVPTGDDVGQVAHDFALTDQYGDTVRLHDFCDRVVMLEFSGFT